jgi:hypothetical protein
VSSDQLARDIQELVKLRLAAHEYPRHMQFTDQSPMTATGKVLRRELRARGNARLVNKSPNHLSQLILLAVKAGNHGRQRCLRIKLVQIKRMFGLIRQ